LTGPKLAAAVIDQLTQDKRVRQELAGAGRVHFDRRVPFLCVYRRPPGREDAGTKQIISSETAYLIVPAEPRPAAAAMVLLRSLVKYLAEYFGGCLIVELWATAEASDNLETAEEDGDRSRIGPKFEIVTLKQRIPRTTVESLSKSLAKIKLSRCGATIDIVQRDGACPPGMKPLLKGAELQDWNCFVLGLAMKPAYRDPQTNELFPSVVRSIRRGVNRALKQAFFTFAHQQTKARPSHFYALGRRSVVKSVFEVDRELAQIDRSFDLLLQATPVNAESAWREFRRGKFERPPVFYYRPLVIDPTLQKRRLYAIPVEKIEDPTLSYLFRQKQEELDRQITLLSDIDSPRFLPESLQIYGGVSDSLLEQATTLLDRVPTRSGEDTLRGQLSAAEFASRAEKELDYYRKQCPDFSSSVHLREDLYTGMMVSGDQLLIGGRTRVPKRRVDALLQHEIGTHLVTRYNGRIQPFQQLEVGLAGYDGLQEGLAVLSEYLVGELSRFRIRVLAARVIAAHRLVDGASFIDTFRMLDRTFEFSQRTAYTITMRTYRGGGLTKDAVYLRGLLQILKYIREGDDLEPLYIGKVASSHLPLIAELRARGVIKPPALQPRYLQDQGAMKKIELLRGGLTVLELLSSSKDQ
jgi:uncharacterized protein (TIGR02421 family)